MSKEITAASFVTAAWFDEVYPDLFGQDYFLVTAVHSEIQMKRLYASDIYRNPLFTVSKLETAMRGFSWDTILVETPSRHESSHTYNR